MAGALHQIMLPVRGDGKGDNVFAHAAALAKRFGAHMQVVHCRPKPEDLMSYGVVVPGFLRNQLNDVAARMAEVDEKTVREAYNALVVEHGLEAGPPVAGRATAAFLEYTGKQMDAVKHHGRLADLICVPQPDASSNLGFNTLKSAIFSSGRPVMMCPEADEISEDLGRHVALGWNGSLEATRALSQGMALIEAAEEVTLLTTGSAPHATTAEELQAYLATRGVTSRVNRFDKKGSIGRSLLDLSTEIGADILLMGAYHESYERETIFGGNTQTVVNEAKIPVVLVH